MLVDADLERPAWAGAEWTPRFAQAETGRLASLATQAALLWDEQALYAAFRLEERDVWTTGLDRTALLWEENAVGIAVAGPGAWYELCISPANRTSEVFFVWKDAYRRGGRYDTPEFDLTTQRPMVFGGDAGPVHPRGLRWGFLDWHLPGLRSAVRIDGTLDQRGDVDRGWTVEIALPWAGLDRVAAEPGPPRDGDCWPISLARVQMIDQRAQRYAAVWQPYPTKAADWAMPDRFPGVRFCTDG